MLDTKQHGVAALPVTQWTMVEQAGRADGPISRQCLIQFLQQYMVPMRVHLELRFGTDHETAKDVVQSFIADKVLERNLLGSADRHRGSRFRTFLLTSLDRYAAQRREYERAIKRRPDRLLCLDEVGEPVDDRNIGNVFEIEWARKVLADAMKRMCSHCMATGRMDIWRIFQQRLWLPISTGADAPSYQDMAVLLGLQTAIQAANLIITAKRMFERNLRLVIGEYCITNEEIEMELTDLCESVRCPCA